MNQKKPVSGFWIAGCFLIILLVLILLIGLPMLHAEWQKGKEAKAAAEAEAAKILERRGGAAEHIEVIDESAPWEKDNFTLWKVTFYSYDSQGRCTAMDRYDSEGELFSYEHYIYDRHGNCILEQSESPGLSWETYREIRYTYDEENRLTLKQYYDGDILSSEHFYRYMPDGSTYLVSQYYDEKGQKGSWYTKIFNENDDPVSEYKYNEEDQVVSCNLYRYDEEGRQIYFICYNKGDESTKPLREVITEYGEDQAVRLSYEPLGHLNSVHYVIADENTKTEMYYLAGYSGGSGDDGIYILGQEEPKWNRELKFWEGLWQTCKDDDVISSLNCSFDSIHSYTACWYEAGNKVRELEYSGDITTMNRYVYNGDGTLAECYRYGFSGESMEEELQDGTWIRLDYEGSKLKRLLCTDADGIVLREIIFDTGVGRSGDINEWYEPLKEQMWAEALIPTEEGIVPADQADREANANDEEQEEDSEEEPGRGELVDEMTLPCYYEVEKGDSLWKIAGCIYGDPYQFVTIYSANKAVIGPDWNFIPAGMVLYLPEPEKQ